MVDLSFLKQFAKGNSVKMKKYIAMYLKIAPEVFERMHVALNNQNWPDLAINAHALKPQAEFIGAMELKEVLIQIELAINNNDTSNISSLYKTSYKIHQEVTTDLLKLVESI